jgi:NADH:ubiquinone oxidoreductase subunit 2 (subunit N)
MFVFFTPYTYLFLSLYFIVILFIVSINNFFMFWLLIEIVILLFIGVSYTVFIHSYTQLILYFLFQTLASFSILVFYIFSYKYLLFVGLFFKLGIFPFFSWYINVLYRFPSFILFLSSTLHKLPPIYIFYMILEYQYINYIMWFCILTVLISSVYMLYVKDLRYLIIVSSVGNNAFLLLAMLTNNIVIFILFYGVYILNTYLILHSFGNLRAHSMSYTSSYSVFILYLFVLLLNLGSFPPMPGFFTKFLVFFTCVSLYPDLYFYLLLVMLFNVIIIVTYILIFFKYIINVYTAPINLVIY